PAAEEIAGVEIPEREIGIRDRRLRAAESVARWPRARAGALRTDLEQPEMIDPREASAARADLDHLHHGELHRESAAALEAIDLGDLGVAAQRRRAVADQAQLGRRAA